MEIKECKLMEPISCHKNDNVVEVSKKLRDNKVRHLVVVDDKNHPIGIIASVDIVNKIVAEEIDCKGIKVEDIMTKPVFVLNKKDWVSKAYVEMAKRNIFSCPIVNGKGFAGMLTFQEVIKHLSKKKAGDSK